MMDFILKYAPLLALTISSMALIISIAAWWTSKQKLRLDLYSHRIKYFDAIKAYFEYHRFDYEKAAKAQESLSDLIYGSEFMFSPDMVEFLRAIYYHLFFSESLYRNNEILSSKGRDTQDIVEPLNSCMEERKVLSAQLSERFKPYLDFSDASAILPVITLWKRLRSYWQRVVDRMQKAKGE